MEGVETVTIEEMLIEVKKQPSIYNADKDLEIIDICQEILIYCNLTEIPAVLEPFVRKKIKNIINYEAEKGTSNVFDVKSISEGDTSISYNVSDKNSKETIYGLSDSDKKTLQQFRRTRR